MSPSLLPFRRVPTRHFVERARERGLAREVEDFIVAWGTAIEARDHATYYTIVRRDLPDGLAWSSLARRADGWVVVIGGGALITCYRDRRAWRSLKRRREERRRAA